MEHVQKIQDCPHDPEVRIVRRMEIGSAFLQGHVYFHRVADDHPCGELIGEGSVPMVAGERNDVNHRAIGPTVKAYRGTTLPDWVVAPAGVEPAELLGPLVKTTDPWLVPHSEHAHFDVRQTGAFQVVYQYDPRTMKASAD
jgi:hypothetical protein